jgi:hypothetical protein
MKTITRSIVYLYIVALLALSSCGKDDDPIASKTDLLTAKAWKQTKIKVLGMEAEPDDCDKDNTYTFITDKTFVQDEGATKCDANDPQSSSGTWKFNTDETIVTVSATDGGITFSLDETILELSQTTLKVKYNLLGVDVEETYSH